VTSRADGTAAPAGAFFAFLRPTGSNDRCATGCEGRESYTPFGELLDDPSANRNQPGFTGHVRDAATGLTYAQARYYNPVTARFLSPDPVGFVSGGPGYFNRYAYTANDPLNLVDPNGEQSRTPRHRGRIVFSSPNVQTRYEAAAARNEQLHQQLGGGPSIRPTPPSIVLPSHARRLEMANQTLARAVNARNGAAPDLGLSIDSITLRPGPFARESIPAQPGRPSPSQQSQINRIGNTFGCHTCGTSNSGRASSNSTADHQPPSNLRPAGSEQRFFPQCASCSARQGAEVSNANRRRDLEDL